MASRETAGNLMSCCCFAGKGEEKDTIHRINALTSVFKSILVWRVSGLLSTAKDEGDQSFQDYVYSILLPPYARSYH